jgi:site-specific DNA recombinase
VYLRVSTDEQRERQSIATQREFAERYCQLHNLVVYRVYADDGVTGTLPLEERPQGSQILQDARQGKFDQLLLYKLDRLGRETRLILNAVAELEKHGVRVRSMTEEFDTGTATGRLMLTLLSGFASHEREVIRERSQAGILRLVESGAWLGGMVPYGYRKVGQKRDARLVISEDPLPGSPMSEAEVIREVFRLAVVERRSCCVIAARLNQLRIPCAYVRDDRLTMRGERRQRTSGVWSPGRIRALITNKTYMGIHEFGKRSSSGRPLIMRSVPAIVNEDLWHRAQANLKAHFLFSQRSAKTQYLLRGLIKCGMCGLSYIGSSRLRGSGRREIYYTCNGAHTPAVAWARGKCPAKSIRGVHLEEQIWSDIVSFLRHPEPVLEKLQARLESDCKGSDQIRKQIARLAELAEQKVNERNRVVSLYRRGLVSETEVDLQMAEIAKEQSALQAQMAELRGQIAGAESVGETISSAQALLAKLRQRLQGPITWEQRRRLIEILVADIRVDTTETCGVKQSKATVTYRFSQPEQGMPLILPQSYDTGSVIRIPVEPHTIGDHVRRRRLSLKMLQREVGEQIGVHKGCIRKWEANQTTPEVRHLPAIIRFLGYNPLPESKDLGARLVRARSILGLTQEEAARRLGVDQGTLAKWERGEREPAGALVARVRDFLKRAESTPSQKVARPA